VECTEYIEQVYYTKIRIKILKIRGQWHVKDIEILVLTQLVSFDFEL
jgi:hypothetical protein